MSYDNIDKKLLNELIGDGRVSLRSLGEELDVSVTTVSNHIADLEEAGVIEGYTPIINYGEWGYDITAIVQLKVKGDSLPDITEALRQHKHMVSIYEVTGDHDITAIGKFTDTDHMNEQIKDLLIDPNIKESQCREYSTQKIYNKIG